MSKKFLDPETKTPMIRDESLDVEKYDVSKRQFLDDLGIPNGFKRIMWWDVKEDQKVYLWGSQKSLDGSYRAIAYGPHWIYNKEKRMLHNRANRVFIHYPNELLVKI